MKNYLDFGIELAEKAGAIIFQYFAKEIKKEWKEDNTPVTAADIAVNKLVIESILKEYPTHGILGEEESFMQESEYVWVCDPIDGTFPFSHGIPTFTFSLALTHNGNPVSAVVYDPVMKRMYAAEKGKGAYMNRGKINVSKSSTFERQSLGIEGYHSLDYELDSFRKEIREKLARIYHFGSITYENLLVAQGEFIASIFLKKSSWDCAAVKLLIDEAGGKTTDLYGHEQRYDKPINGFVGSNGVIHEQLLELLSKTVPYKRE